jgi:hypothetical protein
MVGPPRAANTLLVRCRIEILLPAGCLASTGNLALRFSPHEPILNTE